MYTGVMRGFNSKTHSPAQMDVFDLDGAYRAGGDKGLYDRDTRIAQMDREGIAFEFMTNGDPRISGFFFQSSNQVYPMDVCQAGVKGYHRWLKDEFGPDKDRLGLVGMPGCGPWRDVEDLLEEIDWLADNGFVATNLPGFTAYRGQLPLFDRSWDPLWARCEELGLPLWTHAGYGEGQGELGREIAKIHARVTASGGTTDYLVQQVQSDAFQKGKIFSSAKPRRVMWQLMMSGVFDRFPKLKFVLSEVYGDWMPATMQYLDKVFEEHRGEIPAKRKPSEYWAEHGINCLSFIRKCEVAARREIGLKTIAFGRDYPHMEGTWPNTKLWLQQAFAGVPANEVRDILGENAIRFLGMDRAKLAAIAERINAPTIDEILGHTPAIKPELLEHWDRRARYLAESEGDTRIPEIRELMREDLWSVRADA
jgi:predicted TIM-barrel fold metal-dependent hydrolase